MPWVDRGLTTVNPGGQADLMSVVRTQFRMAVRVSNVAVGDVQYWAILRHMVILAGVNPSIDSEISLRRVWFNATQWEVGNARAEGRIALYVPSSRPSALTVRSWEWVP